MQNQAEVTAVEEEESVAKIHIGSAVREIGMKIIFVIAAVIFVAAVLVILRVSLCPCGPGDRANRYF